MKTATLPLSIGQIGAPGDSEFASKFWAQMAGRPTPAYFTAIFAVFAALYLISWPVVFSLNLWVLKDRASFLNLDYLLSQHLRLGVDTFYGYGLLPVAVQHWLFVLFGRGYWPLLGCALVTLVLMAAVWAFILGNLPRGAIWMAAVLAMSPILNPVSPNLPYSLVQLSMLFALLCVLAGHADAGLAVAAVGCWSVPSLPLLLAAMLVGVIVLTWLMQSPRSIRRLLRALAPGVLVWVTMGLLLAAEFGWRSVLATATPLEGMRFYRELHFGTGEALMQFLYPWGYRSHRYLAYALFTPVAWWVMSTVCLTVLAILAVRRMVVRRAPDARGMVIALCAALQLLFAWKAYGSPHQHYIFDPVLILGVLLGFSTVSRNSLRFSLLAAFLVLGTAGEAVLFRDDLRAWKSVRSLVTANLYADPQWAAEWDGILHLSQHRNVLFFAYSTGVHHYFPTVQSPELWTLRRGQLLPADQTRVLNQFDRANVVVLDLTSPTELVDTDTIFRRRLSSLCLTQSTRYFQIWWRRDAVPPGTTCIANPRGF